MFFHQFRHKTEGNISFATVLYFYASLHFHSHQTETNKHTLCLAAEKTSLDKYQGEKTINT